VRPATFATPIGGRSVSIELHQCYQFSWQERGRFVFAELEGSTDAIENAAAASLVLAE
jgi:hypothetical protein